jgi:putative addiction module component (TIGR02574 family)
MRTLTREEIARLSPDERLSLIGQLWDSLQDDQIPLPEAQRAELARRLSSLDQQRDKFITWEDLRAELAKRRPS